MPGGYGHAICAFCGRTVAMRKDGNLRVHGYEQDPVTGITDPGKGNCDGSGKPPKQRV